jgi:hypothetical protein
VELIIKRQQLDDTAKQNGRAERYSRITSERVAHDAEGAWHAEEVMG